MLAAAAGAPDPARIAWQAGLFATFSSGVIELACAFVAERVRKATPRAALLSTLAGIALSFISLGFLFRTFARPVVGLTTLGIVMLTYFGRVRFKGHLPGGVVAVAVGTLLCWLTGIAPVGEHPTGAALHLPIPVVGDLVASIAGGYLLPYLSVIIAMGLFNVLGSLQNIESADAAGDSYDTRFSLTVNGIGSIAAALFGSAFPTTIYIGHPGWKALGARAGYSVLNGAFVTTICVTGTLAWIAWAIPIDAGMAIVLWIGMMIVSQAFQATPREHAPAVVVGLLPGIGAWGALMAKNGLHAAGLGDAGSSVLRGGRRGVPEERHLDSGSLRDRAGLSLHRDAAVRRGRGRHRAAMGRRVRLVRDRRRPLSDGPDALLSMDDRGYDAQARARMAVRDRLRRNVAVVPRGAMDDGGRALKCECEWHATGN